MNPMTLKIRLVVGLICINFEEVFDLILELMKMVSH